MSFRFARINVLGVDDGRDLLTHAGDQMRISCHWFFSTRPSFARKTTPPCFLIFWQIIQSCGKSNFKQVLPKKGNRCWLIKAWLANSTTFPCQNLSPFFSKLFFSWVKSCSESDDLFGNSENINNKLAPAQFWGHISWATLCKRKI